MTTLRDELLKIREQKGELRPQHVVDAARNPDHPLHSRFEWDDRIAADKHRLAQARKLIRICKIVVDEGDEYREPQRLRAFVSVPSERGGQVYDPTEEVAVNPVLRAIVLQAMVRDWQVFKRRYQAYSELFELIANDPDVTASSEADTAETG